MTSLAGISLPELAVEEQTRNTDPVHPVNETLRGIEVGTEIGQAVVDKMGAGRVAEVRWLMRRLEEWHRRTLLLLKLELAISLSVVLFSGFRTHFRSDRGENGQWTRIDCTPRI